MGHYNYFRSYSAERGRYTQADPIGLDGGFNRFGYVDGNALGLTDPYGLNPAVLAQACAANPIGCATGGLVLCLSVRGCRETITKPIESFIEACQKNELLNWDIFQKNEDHNNYHKTCDREPPKNLSQCELARWQRTQGLACLKKRSEWEERWGNERSKKPHQSAITNVKRRIKNATEDIINFCPAK